MYIDKIIKKEVTTLLISVGILLIVFIGVSFASFFKVDEGKENVVETGDLAISFCSDSTCDNTYENIGQVIGTTKQNGTSVPSSIYPYPNDGSYSNATPYIFKVTNTGDMKTTITIKLKEDADFLPSGNYSEYSRLTDLYANHLKIAIRKKVLASGSEYQMGDVNMDGIVNLKDIDTMYLINDEEITPTEEQIKLGDFNNNNAIDMSDVTYMYAIIKGEDGLIVKTNIMTYNEISNNIILTGDTIEAGKTATYFLWLYLDETTPNQAQKTYFVGNLDIQGEYIPDGYTVQKTDCTIQAGTGKSIGDEVKCGTEEFYIYSNDGTNIKMLAKNVLMVGSKADTTSRFYGLQAENIDLQPTYTIAFDSGTNSYEKSNIKVYVDNYKERLLRRYNLSSNIEATLITLDELLNLGCTKDTENNHGEYTCKSSSYNWIYNTMYWTQTDYADNSSVAYGMANKDYVEDGILSYADVDNMFLKTIDTWFGVRPVIIVPVKDIIK